MARGAEAKNIVVKKIRQAFGTDWIGEYDKKYYVWSKENGEKIQVCISMTCPKTFVECERETNYDFENMPSEPVKYEKAEMTEDEHNIAMDLMRRLGM